jgi:hypothetical protein
LARIRQKASHLVPIFGCVYCWLRHAASNLWPKDICLMKPILFLNLAWMRSYKGLKADIPKGTFAYMRTEKGKVHVHEAFNFLPTNGKYYGYAAVKNGHIDIRRLGADRDDTYIDNVLVVWTATRPGRGKVIVGWYKNARVLADAQWRPWNAAMRAFKERIGYSVVASVGSSRLLEPDLRVFPVPNSGKGRPGQSVSYFPPNDPEAAWVRDARDFIATGRVRTPLARKKGGETDPELRAKVELAAIKLVTRYYEAKNFNVVSCEKDNVGWDLEASLGSSLLKIEVKGRSSSEPLVEVTPNEYRAMKALKHRPDYRMCIVTSALNKVAARLAVFAYSPQDGAWISDGRAMLVIKERLAASLSVA